MSDKTIHINGLCESRLVVVLDCDPGRGEEVANAIRSESGCEVTLVQSAPAALDFINENHARLFAGVVAASTSENQRVLDVLTKHFVRSVVYCSDLTAQDRDKLTSYTVVDVVFRNELLVAQEVGKAVSRLLSNQRAKILIVDDSRSMRAALTRFLALRNYGVVEAPNGKEALVALDVHPEIRVVITDNEMPEMDGYTLVQEIRKRYSKDDLAVIGISAIHNSALSVGFINKGANDFLKKPFVKEELFCRVEHNVEMLNRIETIRELSYKDPLTKLYNRRYFFENCDAFIAEVKKRGQFLHVAMVDVDHFKRFNDTYGHAVGDQVLKKVAEILQAKFPEGSIVCRFGGEEFCVLLGLGLEDDIFACYDIVRRYVENARLKVVDSGASITVSIGVCTEEAALDEMIKAADGGLYAAKEAGRNRVIMTSPMVVIE